MSRGGQLSIFVPINKIDEEQRLVYGQVAAEVQDNSGEVFDYEGSKPYFEKWSENAFATSGGKSHGNVRVMHTSKVAGIVASPLGFNDDEKTIEACAKVIDDAEWEMVKAGGYTGFSMGGRYVSRLTKDDGTKSYIADPVEISLVDKPCIPTATFAVVKADGLTEERRFREDLYKSETGENRMYVPTNDEILPVARDLAKADGKEGPNDWVDYAEKAREQLIAEKADVPGQEVSEAPAEQAEAPAQADEPAAKADDAHDPESCDKDDCEKCAAMKADNPFSDKKKDGEDGDGDEGEEEDEKASKGDVPEAPELQQGWQAKDGSFHVRKADAVAHNAALNGQAAEPTLSDRLADLAKSAAAIAAGEVIETEAAPEPGLRKSTIDAIEAPLAKFDGFLASDLVKSLYDVRTLADIVQSLNYLHSSLACEASWEGDNSAIPGQVFDSLTSLGGTLIALAEEEIKELLAGANKDGGYAEPAVDVMELAAGTLGLEKADLADQLQKRAPAPVEKVAAPDADTLAKIDAANKRADDAVAKAEGLEAELKKVTPLVDDLAKQIELIKAMPREKAPTTRVVSKGDDGGAGAAQDGAPDLTGKTAEQLADLAIKMAHGRGQQITLQTPGNGLR